MRQTDLELYRWKFHNDIYMKFKRVQEAKSQMPLFSYWKEVAAFVSVLPRQVGKTTMIDTITKSLSNNAPYIIVTPSTSMARALISNFGFKPAVVHVAERMIPHIPSMAFGICHTHLFVDEFDSINRKTLDD